MQQITFPLPKSFSYEGRRYYKAMITPILIYYACYSESDENGSVFAFRQNGELASNNYHATNSMFEDIEAKAYTYLSPMMKLNVSLMQDDRQTDQL